VSTHPLPAGCAWVLHPPPAPAPLPVRAVAQRGNAAPGGRTLVAVGTRTGPAPSALVRLSALMLIPAIVFAVGVFERRGRRER